MRLKDNPDKMNMTSAFLGSRRVLNVSWMGELICTFVLKKVLLQHYKPRSTSFQLSSHLETIIYRSWSVQYDFL